MRSVTGLALLASTLVFSSCTSREMYQAEETPEAALATAAPSARKLIKTVDLELRVEDTVAAADRLQTIATEAGGFVASLTARRQNDLLYYAITIRVPVARLDDAVATIKSLAARVERESIRTEDVTDRFVDLDARLETLTATEEELRHLLSESRGREQKAEDIMAIYDKLTEIRLRIEQIQGQLNALENLTTLATVNLDLYPTAASVPLVGERWRPSDTVRSSLRALVGVLQLLADVVIGLLIVALPVAAIVGLPILLLVRGIRRLRRKRTGA